MKPVQGLVMDVILIDDDILGQGIDLGGLNKFDVFDNRSAILLLLLAAIVAATALRDGQAECAGRYDPTIWRRHLDQAMEGTVLMFVMNMQPRWLESDVTSWYREDTSSGTEV